MQLPNGPGTLVRPSCVCFAACACVCRRGGRAAVLPERFDTPMFWDKEDLKELQGTAVVGLSLRAVLSAAFKLALLV